MIYYIRPISSYKNQSLRGFRDNDLGTKWLGILD